MYCTACGSEVDVQGNCPRCIPAVPTASSFVPQGDAFLAPKSEESPGNWRSPVFTVIGFFCFGAVFFLNYLKALHWAGVMNPEAAGYMMGGVFVSGAIGLGVMYGLVRTLERRNDFGFKVLLSGGIALGISMLGLGGEMRHPRPQTESDAKHQAGTLLKEAAGKQPRGKDVNWWDGPSRDFFQDVLEMNQKYSAEVSALDKSAIKNLYSVESYVSVAHMQKVIEQLRAALAVDEKYLPMDTIIQKMKDRVAAANVSEGKKKEFLKGIDESFDKALAPRREVSRTEEDWMGQTIGLYEFQIAHKAEYTIKNGKLVFNNHVAKDDFVSRQTKAIAAHNEFLKAKKEMDESRKKNMDQMGVSPSDLTPPQLGKPQ